MNDKILKLRKSLEIRGYDLGNYKMLKQEYGMPRFAVIKCRKNGLPVVVKISPPGDNFGKKIILREFKNSLSVYKLIQSQKSKSFGIPKSIEVGELKRFKMTYFTQEYVANSLSYKKRYFKNNEGLFIGNILEKIQEIEIKKSSLPVYGLTAYKRDALLRIKRLLKCKLLPKKLEKKIISKYNHISSGEFSKYCGKLCHGDFSELNFIFTEKKFYLIDWEQAHSGSVFTDWARILLRAEMYDKKILNKIGLTKILDSKTNLPGNYKIISFFKEYFRKRYGSDLANAKKIFNLMYLDRLIWYLDLKIPRKNHFIYARIIKYYVNRLKLILNDKKEII
ncbi:MAG: hypothetical protein COY66_02825 [Candidatus Kerfeldbacteria bacterium CG_4_10_14_0_8_um_filter_42_10]|uniref:non-specific serine/threonine protein kinase n=1 Tax=Candidatus Kerfeldbacteria bacterium CG_4_10_14_0_8_um_filter_42_10 TaxID=2014248 RepID=A0A2M7RKD0_9BACT|nr:MAG: hypothetical protein COY66_02825 [Candidatus Kerfeldbacteria bacterium CG_4_10_14_0_8_um_filter_42_10]